jgi:hypothetical protein
MKYVIYIFTIAIPNVELYLLPIQEKKICANCKFFISDKKECSKFGDVDIITGKYNYEDALSVRSDKEKCGEEAIFFKKNYFEIILKSGKAILLCNTYLSFIFLLALTYYIYKL